MQKENPLLISELETLESSRKFFKGKNIPLSDIEFFSEPNEEIEIFYKNVFLRRIVAKYQGTIVWRILYSLDFAKNSSELLMLHTLNNCSQDNYFEDNKIISENIIEKWLWEKFFKNYLEDCKQNQIQQCDFTSLNTSIWFYEKMIQKYSKINIIRKHERKEDLKFSIFL